MAFVLPASLITSIIFMLKREICNQFTPILGLLLSIPAVVYAPLMLLWFGFSSDAKIISAFAASFAPLVVASTAALSSVGRHKVEAGLSLGLRRPAVVMLIVLPIAWPLILAGIRVGLGRCIVGAITAEMMASQAGLGYLISSGAGLFRAEDVFCGILCIVVIALAGEKAITLLEGRIKWTKVGG